MRDRLPDLTIIDYCDLDDTECYVETSMSHDEVDEVMKNPITSILIEDDSNPDILLEYHLVNLIDAETSDVIAIVNFEQEDETLH